MAQEIELKFIVNHSAVEALRDHLNTLGVRGIGEFIHRSVQTWSLT
ncbi:hypothetical protein ACUOFC_50155, partial [Escherichia sp. TWPC-MK]